MYGGSDNDSLHGGNGDDYCRGDAGDDYVAGGDGIDTLLGDSMNATVPDGDDELIFDLLDIGVDGYTGWWLWASCPKLTSGGYAGHGVYKV